MFSLYQFEHVKNLPEKDKTEIGLLQIKILTAFSKAEREGIKIPLLLVARFYALDYSLTHEIKIWAFDDHEHDYLICQVSKEKYEEIINKMKQNRDYEEMAEAARTFIETYGPQ